MCAAPLHGESLAVDRAFDQFRYTVYLATCKRWISIRDDVSVTIRPRLRLPWACLCLWLWCSTIFDSRILELIPPEDVFDVSIDNILQITITIATGAVTTSVEEE